MSLGEEKCAQCAKACTKMKGLDGSNPPLSASQSLAQMTVVFLRRLSGQSQFSVQRNACGTSLLRVDHS